MHVVEEEMQIVDEDVIEDEEIGKIAIVVDNYLMN